MSEWAVASAPATTANLGPAFDCMAMALKPRCTVRARVSAEWSIEHHGELRPVDTESDGVLLAARHTVGDRPLTISVETEIPLGKGLGSSAAAFVAGAAAALRATGDEAAPDRVFRIATELEGHADQTGAAVYGGLVIVPAEGLPMRLPFHPSLRPVVAVPDTQLPTHLARAVLAKEIPMEVVVRSLGRVSGLTAGLITGDPGMLAAAHGDEIHEAPRADLSPEVGHLMDVARRAGALHAARSGAGPSVIAIATADVADRVAVAFREAGADVINQPMDTTGLI
jgi:homoserine kinase